MELSLAELLAGYVKRAQLPVSRIADMAGLPRQTLFNWMNGRSPRWHSRLPQDLTRLGKVLDLNAEELERLLFAAGCACSRDHDQGDVMDNGTFQIPEGWILAGSHPRDFAMGIDPSETFKGRCATLRAKKAGAPEGFGTLMQSFLPDSYRGRRVRFSGWTRSAGLNEGWAGLWMRVDGGAGSSRPLAFDNMQNRPIKGDSNWTEHAIVLDVAETSTNIALGILHGGSGQVWLGSCTYGVVGLDCSTTSLNDGAPREPRNLGFHIA
jgi:hypothetical protein